VRKKRKKAKRRRIAGIVLSGGVTVALLIGVLTVYGDEDGLIYGTLRREEVSTVSELDRAISIFGRDDAYIVPNNGYERAIAENGGEGFEDTAAESEEPTEEDTADPDLIYGEPVRWSSNDEIYRISIELNRAARKNTDYASYIEYMRAGYTGKGWDIIEEGLQYVGYPYVYAGNSLYFGIDCSHYVWQILTRTGHYSGEYTDSAGFRYLGTEVAFEDVRPGDVLCWKGHVGFYLGENLILNAASPELGICVMNVDIENLLGGLLTVRRFE